jgi:hypothetical protein
MPLRCNLAGGLGSTSGGEQTSFSFPVERGEGSERGDEDA